MTREEKIQELLKDEETMKALFDEDPKQTLANFAAYGVEMSMQELDELSTGMLEGFGLIEDELSEESLENVAGGGLLVGLMAKDVASAIKAGVTAGKKDKKGGTVKNMATVEEANTVVGKGFRAIGYTIGWVATKR